MRTTSAIILNGQPLIPAPYVSSNYEYIKYGQYIIGGVLNVNLDGTIVGENISSEIQRISSLSANTGCVSLIIGCEGSADFLQGAGKITNVSVSVSDSSPFTASYTITVSLETVNGSPAVKPDKEFLDKFNLGDALYIKDYEEQIGIDGDATIVGYVDHALNISKSFIKASGSISITSSTTAICGDPSFKGLDQSIALLTKRFEKLISFSFNESNHPLSQYGSWNKWLDNKSITIDESGKVSCSFDVYLTKGGCTPIAHIDFSTEDKLDHRNNSGILNRIANGTIKGMSSSTTSLLDDKTRSNERLANAYAAYSALEGVLANGAWPGGGTGLLGQEGNCLITPCPPQPPNLYFQRLSSNVAVSKVAGEITFSVEFGPVNGCNINNFEIDSTIEEEFPVTRYKEFIIPNSPRPVIQIIGDTPAKATITTQGSIKDCDKNKKPQLIQCVKDAFNQAAAPYLGWIKVTEQITDSKFSYKLICIFIRCDF